jgi:hypothetical protein
LKGQVLDTRAEGFRNEMTGKYLAVSGAVHGDAQHSALRRDAETAKQVLASHIHAGVEHALAAGAL